MLRCCVCRFDPHRSGLAGSRSVLAPRPDCPCVSQNLIHPVELLTLHKQGFSKPQTTHFNFCACCFVGNARDLRDLRHSNNPANHLAARESECVSKKPLHEMGSKCFRACVGRIFPNEVLLAAALMIPPELQELVGETVPDLGGLLKQPLLVVFRILAAYAAVPVAREVR